jgi:hypothetical protein
MLLMNRDHALQPRSFWQFQAIGWTCFYLSNLLGSVPQLLIGHDSVYQETVPIAFMFLGSCALRPVCRWLMNKSQSWIAFEMKATASAVVSGSIIAGAIGLVQQGLHDVDWLGLAPIFVWSTSVLFMWCSLYFSIKQWQQSNKEKERLLRAETEIREARLLALRYQLNPHFLFNSLNAVSTLILDGNAAAATRMLAQIGDLLRSSLDSEVTAEVTLSQELAFTEGYLAIEQTRLGERLKVDMAISSETRDALVPSMLLQPLVENAVRHGVAPLVEGGCVAIRSALHDDCLRIIIANSGRPCERARDNHGNGIGLGNTAERLKTLYGTNFAFSLAWPETGGCEVVLELPLRRAGILQEAAPCVL